MIRIGRRQWIAILKRSYAEITADRASIVASGVAFRVALALFPAVGLLVWIGNRVVGTHKATALVGTLSGLLSDAGRYIIKGALDSARSNPLGSGEETAWFGVFAPLVGLAVTLWSTA